MEGGFALKIAGPSAQSRPRLERAGGHRWSGRRALRYTPREAARRPRATGVRPGRWEARAPHRAGTRSAANRAEDLEARLHERLAAADLEGAADAYRELHADYMQGMEPNYARELATSKVQELRRLYKYT